MIHICTGGPVYRMLLREEIVYFEDHQWCGPTLLNKRGTQMKPIKLYGGPHHGHVSLVRLRHHP